LEPPPGSTPWQTSRAALALEGLASTGRWQREKHDPNFSTVLNVLNAMGFELHVVNRENVQTRMSPVKEHPTSGAFDLD
jgi:hypothetical protein